MNIMKIVSKIYILLSLFLLFGTVEISAKDKEDDSPLRNYAIEGSGRPAGQGSYVVKVTVNTKNKNLPDKDIAKCAVHGVLFHGFSGDNHHTEKPLARKSSAEAEHKEFFDSFFSSSRAAAYANPMQSTRQVTKSGKEYVITEVVEVQKDLLKKDLQDAGVLGSLNSGF